MPQKRRRQSRRGTSALGCLAQSIVQGKSVVIITGAGLSVASGVRTFRGKDGVWSTTVWTKATRQAFRTDPKQWYNEFWLPHFGDIPQNPNLGHEALEELCLVYPEVKVITQNIDGLQRPCSQLIEAHGRVGLYKCLPNEDSDTDSDSDEDHDRPVHLGHRRKSRGLKRAYSQEDVGGRRERIPCRYEWAESILGDNVEPPRIRALLHQSNSTISEPPHCPSCGKPCPPQALLFDEGYHSHSFYQFQRMEEWISSAQVLVFCGTSFAVTVTDVALEHARMAGIPVFNFNTSQVLESTLRLNVENIMGPSNETLPKLLEKCKELSRNQSSS